MSYERLPYEDAATTGDMAADCAVVGRTLQFPGQRRAAAAALAAATPSLVVTDDLAELAAGLELHFD